MEYYGNSVLPSLSLNQQQQPDPAHSNQYDLEFVNSYDECPRYGNDVPFDAKVQSPSCYYEVNRYFCPVYTPTHHHVVTNINNNLGAVTALAFGPSCIYSSNRQVSSEFGTRGKGKSPGSNVAMLYSHEQDTVELYSSVASHDCIPRPSSAFVRSNHQDSDMGVRRIISLMNFVYPGGNDEPKATRPFTVSISSSGVRAHTRGGLLLCESSQRTGPGKVCDSNSDKVVLSGCLHPHVGGSPTHVTISNSRGELAGNYRGGGDQKNIHLLDIYAGLRTITSINATNAYLTCMETNLAHNAIVSGSGDGLLRIIDGNLNPYATRGNNVICQSNIRVNNLATFEDYIAVPDARQSQILLFDMRMISKGYVSVSPTQFMVQRLEYLSSGKIIAVGNHEVQVLDTSLDNHTEMSSQVFYPELQPNEYITTVATDSEDKVAVGTNLAAVILLEEYGREYDRINRRCFNSDGKLNTNHLCKPPYAKHNDVFVNGLVLNYIPSNLNHHGQNPFNYHAIRFTPTVSDDLRLKKIIRHSRRYMSEKLTGLVTENDNCPTNQVCEFDKSCLNFNQFLYSKKAVYAYDVLADPRTQKSRSRYFEQNKLMRNVPSDYRAPLKRVGFRANSQYSKFNCSNGLWAGWDSNTRNVAAPVIYFLYFTPEIRDIVLKKGHSKNVSSLVFELFVVFSYIESVTSCAAASFTSKPDSLEMQKAVSIDNLFRLFQLTPDAAALNLLDDSKSTHSMRVEMFYRFFIHHLEREFGNKTDSFIDKLLGITFNSKRSNNITTRALTIELNYDQDQDNSKSFSHLLRAALQKRTRLRAYNDASKSYETISQVKNIATNVINKCEILPNVLNVSCGCQGLSERMKYWWDNEIGFLPDILEVVIYESGNLTIKQHHTPTTTNVDVMHNPEQNDKVVFTKKYYLTSTVSFIHVSIDDENKSEEHGHYVVHAQTPLSYEKAARLSQLEELKRCGESALYSQQHGIDLTCIGPVPSGVWTEKRDIVQILCDGLSYSDQGYEKGGQWFLFNSFSVKPVALEGVTDFRGNFREPCIVQYRAENSDIDVSNNVLPMYNFGTGYRKIFSIDYDEIRYDDIKIVAIDTEFVSVQLEKSTIDARGEKQTIVEGRSAIARMSLLDVKTGRVIIDDYIRPQEPIVDYLTRFSGIRPSDLDPQRNPRVVSTRTAYMKLRSLVDRGCIFVGHGLEKDFQVMNLYVPPRQIIDTVCIYHQPKRRWISLRFLANFLLKRDMQQDVHDSVEDARAALDLYEMALNLKFECRFDQVLNDIYIHGNEVDWKVV